VHGFGPGRAPHHPEPRWPSTAAPPNAGARVRGSASVGGLAGVGQDGHRRVATVGFWRGWYGPHGWRAGLLSPEDQATWESYDRSFTALAGLEWRIQMRAIEAARRTLDPRLFFEVKYEAFCEQPVETYRRVLEFAELPDSAVFERHVKAASIRSTSNRWRDDLAPGQQTILDDLLREDLLRYGYDEVPRTERVRETAGR
jgi:hypothetical protein